MTPGTRTWSPRSSSSCPRCRPSGAGGPGSCSGGGPGVSLGADKASREKARDEWKKWWDANEKKVDLAKLDQESSYGLTIVCEAPFRGGQGRIVALSGDGKERWKVSGLNWPIDAVPPDGKRVLLA